LILEQEALLERKEKESWCLAVLSFRLLDIRYIFGGWMDGFLYTFDGVATVDRFVYTFRVNEVELK
jgi:hypothetical protein